MKQHLNIEQQIQNLKNKKLQFKNIEEFTAKKLLNNISYHRLMAYRFCFEDTTNNFSINEDFSDISNIYFEDQEIRSHLFNILLSIEMSFRAYVIEQLNSIDYETFIKGDYFLEENFKKQKRNKSNAHLNYQLDKYPNDNIPCWIALESLTFGELRTVFSKLSKNSKNTIATKLHNKNFHTLVDSLSKINDLRNMVAHGENILMRYKFANINDKIILSNIVAPNILNNFQDYQTITNNNIILDNKKKLTNNQRNKIKEQIKLQFDNLSKTFPKLYPSHRIANFYNEKRSFDTFYPYFLIIEFFINTLDLASFHPNLKNNIKNFYKLTKENADYLGIKKEWLGHL